MVAEREPFVQAIVRFDKDTEKFFLIDPTDGKVLHRVQELQWLQRTINNSTKCKQRGINEYAIEDDAKEILAVFTRDGGGKFRKSFGEEPKVQSDGKLGTKQLQIVSKSTFPVDKRFKFLRKMIRMTIAKTCNGMIVTGEGGLLKDNRNSFMVFDDMDAAFKDKVGKDLLKAALDSTARRRMVTWASDNTESDADRSFEFKGTIIFLSNTPLMKIPQPIISRSIYVDLFMTPEEKIEHMGNILKELRPDILTLEEKQKSLDFLDDSGHHVRMVLQQCCQKMK